MAYIVYVYLCMCIITTSVYYIIWTCIHYTTILYLTGRVCIPIDPKAAEEFDPFSVPTLRVLCEEVRVYIVYDVYDVYCICICGSMYMGYGVYCMIRIHII